MWFHKKQDDPNEILEWPFYPSIKDTRKNLIENHERELANGQNYHITLSVRQLNKLRELLKD
jgi:hypothetical protein